MSLASHQYDSVSAYNSYVHQGDVYHVEPTRSPLKEQKEVAHYGLCLTSAPLTDPGDFVGRAFEIDAMQHILRPGQTPTEQ